MLASIIVVIPFIYSLLMVVIVAVWSGFPSGFLNKYQHIIDRLKDKVMILPTKVQNNTDFLPETSNGICVDIYVKSKNLLRYSNRIRSRQTQLSVHRIIDTTLSVNSSSVHWRMDCQLLFVLSI